MHELSICRTLLSQAETIAAGRRTGAIRAIRVRIGALSGVDPDLLQAAFAAARVGSRAAQAELLIETPPITVYCRHCGHITEVTANHLRCGLCDSADTALQSGDELLLVDLTLTTATEDADHV